LQSSASRQRKGREYTKEFLEIGSYQNNIGMKRYTSSGSYNITKEKTASLDKSFVDVIDYRGVGPHIFQQVSHKSGNYGNLKHILSHNSHESAGITGDNVMLI
jgi:hypothetical protein